jgi:hypothetical protein
MLKDHINMMLVYIFIILLLYCIMYLFIYNDKEVRFDNSIKVKTFEKFIDDEDESNKVISGEEADTYYNNLNKLNTIINNINDEQIKEIITNINNIKNTKDEKNKTILDKIYNIYWNRYLENINQANASVFNEYLKYSEPDKNKFYQQYL